MLELTFLHTLYLCVVVNIIRDSVNEISTNTYNKRVTELCPTRRLFRCIEALVTSFRN